MRQAPNKTGETVIHIRLDDKALFVRHDIRNLERLGSFVILCCHGECDQIFFEIC